MRRLALLALLLAGCALPLPFGCRSTWFRRCTPMPAGTVQECVAGATGDHEAAVRACRACMELGDSAVTCSRRMWG